MLSVLLADDERLDREGLYRQIPWSSLQVDEVRLARNGREVLELLHQKPADILLTDIIMPGMSGLELVQEAVRVCPDMKVIFISGYDDFSYAQKAVELGVAGYVLKPVETQAFCKTFQRAAQEIAEEKQQREDLLAAEDKARYGEFLEFSKSVGDFLTQGRAGVELYARLHTQIGNEGPYGLVLAEIEQYNEWISDMASEEAACVLEKLRREFQRPIEGFHLLTVRTKPERYAMLYGSPDGNVLPVEELKTLIEAVKEKCSLTLTLSVSNPVAEIEQLPAAYKQCRSLLLQKVFVGPGTVIEQRVGVLQEGLPVDYLLSQMNSEILQKVRNMEAHHLVAFVEAVFDDMQARDIFPLTIVRNISIQIISRLQFALLEENLGAAFLEDPLLWEQIISAPTFGALRKIVLDYFRQIAQELSQQKQQHYWNIAEQIVRYIEQHYGEDITLKTIAPQFYYSPNHLGVLFKEVTGKTFHEYLTQYRMQVAAKLLKEGSMYVYEVANQVSYKNTIAFSNQFRREYGVKPAEYSARYRRGENSASSKEKT